MEGYYVKRNNALKSKMIKVKVNKTKAVKIETKSPREVANAVVHPFEICGNRQKA